MDNSKVVLILAIMLMILCVGGVYATDDVNDVVSDIDSRDDFNIQIAGGDQSFEKDVISVGDSDKSVAQTWIIDDDNYADYFVVNDTSDDGDRAGTIRDDAPIKDGDTLKLSNLEGKVFNINKCLTITSNSSDAVLHNCMIKLFKGADNSIIHGLNITVDTDDRNYIGANNLPLWPILAIQVSNITIKDNYVYNNATNAHALGLGDVFNSTIYNNTLISLSHPFYLLGSNNLISSNYIKAFTVPGVNGFPYVFYITRQIGHTMAMWYKNTVDGKINNNVIEYNTLDGSGSGWMIYGAGLLADSTSNNTFRYNEIVNGNTVFGVQNAVNYKVYGNNITNVNIGVNGIMNTKDWEVYDNYIYAKSTGIIVDFADKVYNNTIIVNGSSGIGIKFNSALANNTFISNNKIAVTSNGASYGIDLSGSSSGIYNVVICDNDIKVLSPNGNAIGIFGGKDASNVKKIYNGLKITNNKITAESKDASAFIAGIELHPVNESVISNNVIDAKNGIGIYAYSGTISSGITPLTNLTISSNNINGKIGVKVGKSDKTSKPNDINGVSILNNDINSSVVAIDVSSIDEISNINIGGNKIIVNAVNDSDVYALFIDIVNNVTVNKNIIKFIGNVNSTGTQYAVSLTEINCLNFNDNKMDIILPSSKVNYDPITWAAKYDNLGLYIADSNNIEIRGNKFNVNDSVKGKGSDTLCNIYLKGDSNVSFINNDVSISASNYAYAMKVEGYYALEGNNTVYINSDNVTINKNNIESYSAGHYANGFEFGGPLNAIVSNNNIQVKSIGVAYGINAAGYSGDVNLNINNNEITGSSNSVYGVELYRCKDVALLINKIILKGNYTMGIATSSDLTEIIGNEISVKGLALGKPTLGDAFSSDNIGIYASYAKKVFISSNNIDSSKYGIVSDSKEANIVENIINVEGISGIDSIGVKTSAKTNLIGNTITSNGKPTYNGSMPINNITGVLATSDAKLIAFNNRITTNGDYAINVTDSSNELEQNFISNNKLLANKLVGDDSVAFDKGCELNNVISKNTPVVAVMTANNVVKTYGNANKLVVSLKDNKGNIIANQVVTVTIGKSTYRITTNDKGVASLNLKQSVGTYSATIKVASDKYVAASKKVSIKINKVPTIVSAKKVTVKVNKAKYFTVSIKNKANKKSIGKLNIIIKVSNGKKYKIYKVKTNSKGIAKISTKGLIKGTHKVIISSSNKNYNVNKVGNLIVVKK